MRRSDAELVTDVIDVDIDELDLMLLLWSVIVEALQSSSLSLTSPCDTRVAAATPTHDRAYRVRPRTNAHQCILYVYTHTVTVCPL